MISYEPLARKLKEKGWGIRELMEAIGVKSGMLKKYLNEGKYISLQTVEKICAVLECGPDDVFRFIKERRNTGKPLTHCEVKWEIVEFLMKEKMMSGVELSQLMGLSDGWFGAAKRMKGILKKRARMIGRALGVAPEEFMGPEY